MRWLMWLTIGFCGSCGLRGYFLAGQKTVLLWIAAALAASVIAGIRMGQRRCWLIVLAGLLTGGAWFGLYTTVHLSPLQELDGTTGVYTATVTDYGHDTDRGTTADATLSIRDKTYRTRIYFRENLSLSPGDQVTGIFRVRLTMPEEAGDSVYYPGKGVFLLLYPQEEIAVTPVQKLPLSLYPAVLRSQIRQILASRFSGENTALAQALILGDTGSLSYKVNTDFAISGIRHIVAVSGLHVSLLYGLFSALVFRQRHLTAILGLPALLLFAAVAGFTPSVTRACVMISLMILARIFNREYDPPTALSFAVFLMLAINPWAVTSAGLQLSALCVAGILLFQGKISGWLDGILPKSRRLPQKLRKSFCTAVAVSLSAQSLVTPLSAWYFGTVSLIGVVTNVLSLWVVHLIFNGLVAVVALDALVPWLAGLLTTPVNALITGLLAIVEFLAELPISAVFTRSNYIVLWLVFLYLLLLVLLLQKKKQPLVLLCCGLLGLFMALTASWAEPMLDDTRITMLDVGQGQSILLQSQGKSFLVDCGGDDDEETADLVAETLLSQGITRLDGMILTHFDRDHAGGAENLLSRMDTELLFLPDVGTDFSLPETNAKTVYVLEDIRLTFGTAKLTIFGPQYAGDDNENSLCVLFDTEKCDILITGDRSTLGEGMLLRNGTLPHVDILVAGHHGAVTSTGQALLDAVTPETVLISVGANNSYHHPSPETLQRLEQSGCQVYRTDLHGTIVIRR